MGAARAGALGRSPELAAAPEELATVTCPGEPSGLRPDLEQCFFLCAQDALRTIAALPPFAFARSTEFGFLCQCVAGVPHASTEHECLAGFSHSSERRSPTPCPEVC